MNRPAALPLRPGTGSPRIEHLAPGDPSTLLTRDRRERWRASLEQGASLDVLVVGGGITGVGVALDAASRGLRVALVERDDLAAGTSALVQQARPWWAALPRLRPGGGGLGERPRTRRPRRCRRPAPDPPAAPGGALLRRPRRAGPPTGSRWADRRGRPARRRPHAPRDAAQRPVAGPGAGPRARPVARHPPGAWGDGALGLPARGRRPPGRGRRPDGCRLRRGDPHPHRGPVDRCGRGAAA